MMRDPIEELRRRLTGGERIVFEYFVKNISVGEILAEKELKLYGVEEPLKVIRGLIEKGVLERGEGCFNLSKELREYLRRKRFFM